jgi:biotin synthase
MQRGDILRWLRESDPARLAELWRLADQTRQRHVGGEVHLRGLIELSNYCVRLCGYCGLRAGNAALKRYRMTDEEILACARKAVEFGYGTVVMQAGEDPGLSCQRIARLVERIKSETPLAVTLSLGERDEEELAAWRLTGADRYLLRFETSNRTLYERIHPPRIEVSRSQSGKVTENSRELTAPGPTAPDSHSLRELLAPGYDSPRFDRLTILATLRRLGYEVGSGVMIGIPGQTYDDLADDIELFARLDLDMIGVGPYLRHPQTPLADRDTWPEAPDGQQVPATEEMTYKVLALARLVCPRANIPATTALATLNKAQGRELGLERGANVVMPNLTPPQYRALYEIYPDKACIAETGEACHRCLIARIGAIGRQPGRGRGDSANHTGQAFTAGGCDDRMVSLQ